MEANELRIGNLIYNNYVHPYAGKKKDIVNVESINKNGINLYILYDGFSEYSEPFINETFNIEDLSGIPLSEEILLKVGFEKENNSFWDNVILSKKYLDNEKIYRMQNKENSLPVFTDQNRFYMCHKNCELKYLHQLQNLYFALTGQELNTSGL